jgi:polyvinyl alcohol dehydrogenase (cytochrome)
MSKLLIAALVAGALASPPAAFAVSSTWTGYGQDLSGRRAQPQAGNLNADSVRRLQQAWSAREKGLDAQGNAPFVTSTPAVAHGLAVWGDWQGAVHAVSVKSGARRWTTRIPGGTYFAQVNDSPAIAGTRVFVGTGGSVVALDRRSGRQLWSTVVDSTALTDLFSSPTVVSNTVVIGVASVQLTTPGPYTFHGSVVALDARTGRLRWRTWVMRPGIDGTGGSVWSTAAADPKLGLAYIGTGQAYEDPAGPFTDALLALRLKDGHLVWKRQFTSDDLFNFFGHNAGRDYDIGASPNLFRMGARPVVGVGDKAGRYAVLDARTGTTVWRRKLCSSSHLGGIMTTAAVAHGSIWATCNDLENKNELADARNQTNVLRLEAATGRTRWRKKVRGGTAGAVTEAGGVVFVPNTLGTVRAFDARSGSLLWRVRPGGRSKRFDHGVAGGISVAGGRVLVPYGYTFIVSPVLPTNSVGGVVAYRAPRAATRTRSLTGNALR